MEHTRAKPEALAKIAAATLAVLLLAMVGVNALQQRSLTSAGLQIQNVYQKAFYESCELFSGLQLNLRKLLVSGSGAQEQTLFTAIAQQAQGIENNLSLLPLGQETIASAVKFVNQTGDYARTLSARLARGGAVSEGDWSQLSALSEAMNRLTLEMNDMLARYVSGEAVFTPADFERTASEFAQTADGEPAVDYPSLLYDGPFSDGRESEVFAGLTGAPVDSGEAARALGAFVRAATGSEARVEFAGESSVPVDCWDFTVDSGGYQMSAGVTKLGGHVFYMLPENDVTESLLTREECVRRGLAFLAGQGFGEMNVSYWRAYDGILTVNYAAVQEGVVLYPDLIKLQISMKDGAIIGVEASNYYANHIARGLAQPMLDVAEAVSRVSDVLTVTGVKLCVIPLETGEAMCYEISAARGESENYLVYIDANTGLEREIMQLVNAGDDVIAQ